MQWHHDGFIADSDPEKIDLGVVYGFLKTSYWAAGRSRDAVERAWRASCVQIGLYNAAGEMVGGCRVVTDTAVFAWLADVFVCPGEQGHGLGKFLLRCVLSHPDCNSVGQFLLGTKDAHAFYRSFGWIPHDMPERLMIRRANSE